MLMSTTITSIAGFCIMHSSMVFNSVEEDIFLVDDDLDVAYNHPDIKTAPNRS